jgi:hypothetical protein
MLLLETHACDIQVQEIGLSKRVGGVEKHHFVVRASTPLVAN